MSHSRRPIDVLAGRRSGPARPRRPARPTSRCAVGSGSPARSASSVRVSRRWSLVEGAEQRQRPPRDVAPGREVLPAMPRQSSAERKSAVSPARGLGDAVALSGDRRPASSRRRPAPRRQAAISAEIAAITAGLRARAASTETQPRLDYPPYRSQPAAAPHQGPAPRRPRGHRAVGAGLRAARRRPARGRPDHPARRRAGGRADGRHRPGARRRRPAGAPPAGRDLAGQRRRPLHPPARPAPGRRRPELHRRRPLPHRRRRRLPRSPRSSRAPTRGRTTATRGGRRTSTSRCSAPSSPSG